MPWVCEQLVALVGSVAKHLAGAPQPHLNLQQTNMPTIVTAQRGVTRAMQLLWYGYTCSSSMSLYKFQVYHEFANNPAAALPIQSKLSVPNSVKPDWPTRACANHWPTKVHRRQCPTEGCHIVIWYTGCVLCKRTNKYCWQALLLPR